MIHGQVTEIKIGCESDAARETRLYARAVGGDTVVMLAGTMSELDGAVQRTHAKSTLSTVGWSTPMRLIDPDKDDRPA